MTAESSKGGGDRPNARAKAAAARELQRKREARRRSLLIGGLVTVLVVVVAVMAIVYLASNDKKKNAKAAAAAPATVVKQVTSVPAGDFAKVDTSQVTALPTKVTGSALTFDGKPGLLYLGAEYCPYCASERWPVVVAMSRFGTWSSLGETTSASQDIYPNTPTFSFYGAKFSSPYLSFQSVETKTNQLKNGDYTPLQTPTAAQSAIVEKYDSKGSIPFVDFGNKYVTIGATYKPDVLKGKSFDEIAADITDPSSEVGKSILGTANTMTAAICEMTAGKPSSVCDVPTIKRLRSALDAQQS